MGKEWFTQPKDSFASYYYHEGQGGKLIRIRLELGRTEENGQPQIIVENNKYVGFHPNTIGSRLKEIWGYRNDRQIIYLEMYAHNGDDYYQNLREHKYNSNDEMYITNIELSNNPSPGLKVYDFSLSTSLHKIINSNNRYMNLVHMGNPVIAEKAIRNEIVNEDFIVLNSAENI